MPITRSAKKALRQSLRRRARNILRKDAYRAAVRDFKRAVESKTGDMKALQARLYKALDKAAKTRAISRNKASRLKSRLTKSLAPRNPA